MGGNELGYMPPFCRFSRHVVGATTGLHRHRAGLKAGQVPGQPCAIEFLVVELMTAIILRMQMEGMFP
ncbi:hypothetical protein D3C86_1865930 [compost metagenome]